MEHGFLAVEDNALENRLSHIRRRCLLLLSFLYDADIMKRVGHHLGNEAANQRAIALVVLDTTLPRKLNRSVLPLFEGTSPVDCLRKLEASFQQQPCNRTTRLRSFLTDADRNLGPWVQACALYSAGNVGDDTFLTQMREMRSSANQIVRETAWWAVSELDRKSGVESYPDAKTATAESGQPHTSGRKTAMLLTVEKVILLKSVSVRSPGHPRLRTGVRRARPW